MEEMSVMMACWKRNDFNQQRCSQELSDFHNCVIAAQVSEKSHSVIVNEMGLLLFFCHCDHLVFSEPALAVAAVAWSSVTCTSRIIVWQNFILYIYSLLVLLVLVYSRTLFLGN